MQQAQRGQRSPLRRFTYSRRGYEISEVDGFVTEVSHQLGIAQQRIQLLEGQLDQLSHENEALTQMINHVARLGEQMVAEARQEAYDIVAGARSEAQERVVVARADAKTLVANGCKAVSEGANMPTDLEGVHIFKAAKLLYAPGKASNAGGVAVSGLEMSQNSGRRAWGEAELQQMLKDIMSGIHKSCLDYGDQGGGYIDYVKGANIAGFKKVADAMLAFGVV